jgi:hypothetical protein
MNIIFKDYHFDIRNNTLDAVTNVEHFVDGDGESISAKSGRMIDAEVLRIDPNAYIVRKRQRCIDKL